MKTVHYENIKDKKGNKKSLLVPDVIYEKITVACNGHYGFGGADKKSFYVEVNDWNKCLEIVNVGIRSGWYPYVKRESFITIK